jgi:uncharacterized membrane protein
MMDFAFVVLTIVFFVASWWFVRACASLEPKEEKK